MVVCGDNLIFTNLSSALKNDLTVILTDDLINGVRTPAELAEDQSFFD